MLSIPKDLIFQILIKTPFSSYQSVSLVCRTWTDLIISNKIFYQSLLVSTEQKITGELEKSEGSRRWVETIGHPDFRLLKRIKDKIQQLPFENSIRNDNLEWFQEHTNLNPAFYQ